MKPVVAVIAQGSMGAGIGRRLAENDIDVVTSLEGRSKASAERAAQSAMRDVPLSTIAAADVVLSVVPPSDALALAERLAPHFHAAARKPLYLDCNAVSSDTACRIAEVVMATGAAFADGGIIGGPPRPGYDGPRLYVSGAPAVSFDILGRGGIVVRPLDGPVGAASALKMSYAAITKGLTAIASASILAAAQHGASHALYDELTSSRRELMAVIARSVPAAFPKAYRFVGEMEEIAGHFGRASSMKIYRGMARLYQEIADDLESGGHTDVDTLRRFFDKREG